MNRIRVWCLGAAAVAACVVLLYTPATAKNPKLDPLPSGIVAAHLIGRVVVASDGTCEIIGYYPFVDGLGPMFAGDPGEKTAYLTLRSGRFRMRPIFNAGLIHLRSEPAAGTVVDVNVYFNAFPDPNRDFANPATFSGGQLVATFRPRGTLATILPLVAISKGSIDLVSSSDFEINGIAANFRDVADSGTISLQGTAPAGGAYLGLSFPFGGTVVSAGRRPGPP